MPDRRQRRHLSLAASAPQFFEALEALEPRQMLAGDGRPTAALVDAAAVATWGSTYTFRVAYTDDVSVNPATLDSGDVRIVGPNGYNRNAKFYRATVAAGGRTVNGFYKISAPGGVWDAADNGGYSVFVNPSQVRDNLGNVARAVKVGWFTVNVPQYPSAVALGMATKGIVGLDVTQFGATPDDAIDDTAAIQRAIDALPTDGDGVPDPAHVSGGILVFPIGTFNTSRPLRIPPAVLVRGQGAGTVIANSSANPGEGAFELTADNDSGFNIRAGIENLKITTVAAKGIKSGPLRGDLVALRLTDLTISAGGVGIDLRDARAYGTEIRRVTIENPGSTAVWIGPEDDSWISNVNRIMGLSVVGPARANFRAERAMVVLGGDIFVEGLSIGETGAPVTPLYATMQPVFERLRILATQNVPGGVLATFENCTVLDIDGITLSPGRRIEIRNTPQAIVADLTLSGGAQLMDSVVMDEGAHLRVQTLRSSGDVGRLSDPRVTVMAHAAPHADAPRMPSFAQPKRPVSQTVVDVTRFGAIPDDGQDDSASIQRAIDALPAGSGIPGQGEGYTGGLVLFPPGRFDTVAPLEVPSGVWLRGHANATVIYNTLQDDARGSIELVGRHAHGFNVSAAVEDLSIYTEMAMGVRAAPSVTAGLVDVRLSGLTIGAGFRAIDLGGVRSYHATLHNVIVQNAGSTALVMGDAAGYSADNRVVGLQMLSGGRDDFRAEQALVALRGSTYLLNGWIDHPLKRVLPLRVEGAATIRGLWLEYRPDLLPDHVVAHFENTTRVDIDRMQFVSPGQQLKFVNAKDVRIDTLSIEGVTTTLGESVTVDGGSSLNIGLVRSLRDAGLLDHPRVRVEAVYNDMDGTLIRNTPPSGPNLIVDPTFGTVAGGLGGAGGAGGDEANWSVTWGFPGGGIDGDIAVEQTPNGPRLKVTITSNPINYYVTVKARLNVPPELVGRHAVARWRIDGPGLALMYHGSFQTQYSARAMNSLTATRTPVALRANDYLIFTLPAVGTYYISNLSLTPV